MASDLPLLWITVPNWYRDKQGRDLAMARRAESRPWWNILTKQKNLEPVPARNFSANSRMDFVSAKSSFFTMTCWFPVSARISLAAASAFAMSLQAIMTLAPAKTGGEKNRNRNWDHCSTLDDQGYNKPADYAQHLQTIYCFFRELASVRREAGRDKAFSLHCELQASCRSRKMLSDQANAHLKCLCPGSPWSGVHTTTLVW